MMAGKNQKKTTTIARKTKKKSSRARNGTKKRRKTSPGSAQAKKAEISGVQAVFKKNLSKVKKELQDFESSLAVLVREVAQETQRVSKGKKGQVKKLYKTARKDLNKMQSRLSQMTTRMKKIRNKIRKAL